MRSIRRKLITPLFLAALTSILAVSAESRPSYSGLWSTEYPGSDTLVNVLNGTGSECQLCHASASGGNPWNAYGWAIRTESQAGATIPDAINIVAGDDSDLDPTAATNDDEIFENTQPGWTPGQSNTIYFKNLTTVTNQEPPAAILGLLDPPAPPTVACHVETNLDIYVDGDTLVLHTMRFANPTPEAVPVRMRLQFELPNGAVINAIDVGQGGGFALPPGFNNNFGPLNLFTISRAIPRGSFAWSCSLEDPTTAEVLAQDTAPFEVQ